MILPRSHTWAHLTPSGTSYECDRGVPPWFRAPLGDGGSGDRTFVTWGPGRRPRPDLGGFDGLVSVNGGGPDPASLREAGFADVRRFAVLPSLAEARWFIPLDGPATSAAAFCLYTPFRASARLKLSAVRAAIHARLPVWYRDRVVLARRQPPPLCRSIQALFPGRRVALALSTGAVGPDERRKPSFAVLDPSGTPLAFVKVAGSPVADALVRHEARVLSALSGRPGLAGRAPRLLWAGAVDGTRIIVQSPVPGRRVGPAWTASHRDFLDALGGGPVKPAASTGLVATLALRVRSRPDLAAALGGAWAALAETPVAATVCHTDFVPWNLKADRGALAAFDWDTAELDGLPHFDEWHHRLMVGYCLDRWSAGSGADYLASPAASTAPGLDPNQVRALQVVYLVHSVERLLAQGHPDGHPMVHWYRRLLDQVRAAGAEASPRFALAP